MFYFQIMLGIGLGIIGAGVAYFMTRPIAGAAYSHRSTEGDGDSWNARGTRSNRRRNSRSRYPKSRVGDKCTVCLEELTAEDIQFLKCNHALHNHCFKILRKINPQCPICNKQFVLSFPGDLCCICFEEMDTDNMAYLKCQHALHEECLRKNIEQGNRTCPQCRA